MLPSHRRVRLDTADQGGKHASPSFVTREGLAETKIQHVAAPLTLQFLIGFTNQLLYTVSCFKIHNESHTLTRIKCLNTLLLDYWPGQSASAQAANNLVRCELAAVGLAAIEAMLRSLRPGWCFTVFAGVHMATFGGFILLETTGLSWRRKRRRE